ncbi:hypothetical protein ROZALSC1DRAFT_26546, partial [Rozella allomycis CSF55]
FLIIENIAKQIFDSKEFKCNLAPYLMLDRYQKIPFGCHSQIIFRRVSKNWKSLEKFGISRKRSRYRLQGNGVAWTITTYFLWKRVSR